MDGDVKGTQAGTDLDNQVQGGMRSKAGKEQAELGESEVGALAVPAGFRLLGYRVTQPGPKLCQGWS